MAVAMTSSAVVTDSPTLRAVTLVSLLVLELESGKYRTGQSIINVYHMSLVVRKPVFGVSDQVRHKPGCTATEDDQRLEISDLERRWVVLSVW